VGEEGIDEGGVQKGNFNCIKLLEFFQLIINQLFQPQYGIIKC
jgi:hypothetical protein